MVGSACLAVAIDRALFCYRRPGQQRWLRSSAGDRRSEQSPQSSKPIFSCRSNADVFIRFLTRLLKSTDGRKIILIVDSQSAHKAAKVARWIEGLARSMAAAVGPVPGGGAVEGPQHCHRLLQRRRRIPGAAAAIRLGEQERTSDKWLM